MAGAQGRGIDQDPAQAAVGGAQAHHHFAQFPCLADGDDPRPVCGRKRRLVFAQSLDAWVALSATRDPCLRMAKNLFGSPVGKQQRAFFRPQHQAFCHRRDDAAEATFTFVQAVDHPPQFGDVLLDRDIVAGPAVAIQDRCDQRPFLIEGTIAAPVLELAVPAAASLDRRPQRGVGFHRGSPRFENAWPLPDDLVPGIAGGLDELVVDVLDSSFGVGNDDCRRVLLDDQRQFAGPGFGRVALGNFMKDAQSGLPAARRCRFGDHDAVEEAWPLPGRKTELDAS
ncbi:MAG: hypothetical protein AW11_00162 [Candidatus Accumulibacter regalis]|uniref:Uncharacterized protein n=1 Tax=Accumulibacter regalis TaxID=522306 RepID=A0A011PVD6_ACCRE|nr:MAG: hypothetical protein AW11_00162 [Candidatus Accumulibacter regalis]